jgi:hypothetical protein
MTTTSFTFVRARRGVYALGGLVLLGAVLGACGSSTNNAGSTTTTSSAGTSATTSTPTSGGSTSLDKIEALATSVQGAEKATFKAVYTITNAATTQTVTIEQSPPKSLFTTKGGSVIDTGTATYYCSDSGQSVCLSAGTSNPLASLTALFSPQTALTELRAVQAEAAAHAAGYNISFSSGSYGGQGTTCATITGTGTNVKYCVTKQGVLAYASSNGGTFALTSYSSSVAAGDFSLPAGSTIMTIPSGTGVPS